MLRRTSLSVSVVVFVLGLTGVVSADTTSWNYADQFSTTSNSGGPGLWVSGYSDGTTLTPYATFGTAYEGAVAYWIGSQWESQGLITKNVTASPLDSTDEIYWEPGQAILRAGWSTGSKSVARWTAPADGTYYIYGHFTDQVFGGATQAMKSSIQVQAAGSTVFQADNLWGFYGRAANNYSDRTPNSNPEATYYSATPISLTAGQNVDFIHYGTDTLGTNQHNFGMDLRISTSPISIPEPVSGIMISIGILGLLAYAWRRRR
jgi:hypothetical protein